MDARMSRVQKMTESLFSKIETSTKQYFGLKVPVNVVAVHSRQINLSPKLVEKWYDEAITWIKSFRNRGQTTIKYFHVTILCEICRKHPPSGST